MKAHAMTCALVVGGPLFAEAKPPDQKSTRKAAAPKSCSPEKYDLGTVKALPFPVKSDLGWIFGSVAVGDLNGDGNPDLVFTNPGDSTSRPGIKGSLSVMLNKGGGVFAAPTQQGFSDAHDFPADLSLGDLTGDGKLDAVTTNLFSFNLLKGMGDGTFAAPVRTGTPRDASDVPVGRSRVADFSGDGKPDVAFAAWRGYGPLNLYLNSGTGTFPTAKTFLDKESVADLAVGDFNGDGKPDFLVGGYSGNRASVLLNLGGGKFGPPTVVALPKEEESGTFINHLVAADFNGDGKADIGFLYAAPEGDAVAVVMNRGDGAFAPAALYQGPARGTGWQSPVTWLIAADLNHDGKTDLVSTGGDKLVLWMNKGDGTLSAPQATQLPNVNAVAAIDLNGTGVLGLVVTSPGPLGTEPEKASNLYVFPGSCD